MADINEVATLEVHGSADSGVDQVVASLNQVSDAQTQVGATAGVSATQQETAAKGTLSAASAYDRLLRSIDPVAKAQTQFATGQATLQKALDQGLISSTQFSASQTLLERSLLGMGTAARGAGDEINTLSVRHLFTLQRSISELGMGLATGASPFSLMAVGAEHAAYILSEGGLGATLSSIGSKLAAMITPTVAFVSGIVAIGVEAATSVAHWVELQDDIDKGLSGIGRASGVTSVEINSIAASMALVGTASYSAAAESAVAFARVGRDAAGSIGIAVQAEQGLIQKIGMDAPAASKALQGIFDNPTKGAEELNKSVGFLSAGLLQEIQTMQAAGDHAGAVSTVIQALNNDLAQQASHVGGLTSLWRGFVNTLSDIATAAGASLAQKLGVGDLQQKIAETTAEIEKLKLAASISPVFNTSVAQANIKALEDHLKSLNQEVAGDELNRWIAGANAASTAAKQFADTLEPAQSHLNTLNEKLHLVDAGLEAERASASPNVAVINQLTAAHNALAGAIQTSTNANGTAITQTQKMTEQYNLQVQAIHARTDAEKIALAGVQERAALNGKMISDADAELAIKQKEQLVIEQLNQKWTDYYQTIQSGAQSTIDGLRMQEEIIGKTPGEIDAIRYSYQAYGALRKEIDSMQLTDASQIAELWAEGTAKIDEQAAAIQSEGDRLDEMQQAAKRAADNTKELAAAFKDVGDSARVAGGIAGGLFDRIDQEIASWSNVGGPQGTSGGQLTLPVGADNPYPPGTTAAETWTRLMTGSQPGQIGGPPAYHFAFQNTGADVTFGGSGAPDSIFVPMYVSPGERLIVVPAGQSNLVPPTGLPGSLNDGGFAQAAGTTSAVAGSGGAIRPSSGTAGTPVYGFGGPTGQTYPAGGYTGTVVSPGGAGTAIAPPGLAGPSSSAPPAAPSSSIPSHWDLRNGPLPATGPTAQGHWTGIGAGTDYFWQSGAGPYVSYAASGIDYRIPGSGPPDSVSMALHVSPGERLIVLPADKIGLVPDLGLPGLSGAASGGVFAASGLDTGPALPRAPASSGGLPADVSDRLGRIEAAVAKFVDGQANGPPALTMINHISAPADSNLGRSSPQVLAQLARDVAAVLASRR